MADQTTVPGLALSAGFGMFYSLYAFHYIEDITWWREDMNFIFERQNNILQINERSEWVNYCFCHKKIKIVSSSCRVMFFLLYRQKDIFDKILEVNNITEITS